MDYIRDPAKNYKIIFIRLELPELKDLLEYHALYSCAESQYEPGKANFVLIDEVEKCQGFERPLNGLHALEKFDLCVTSTSIFLSGSDLATLFTGRTMDI